MATDVTVADRSGEASPAPPHPLVEFWSYFRLNRGAVVGLVVFVAIALMAIFANWVAPHHPHEQFRDALLVPPRDAESLAAAVIHVGVSRDSSQRIAVGEALPELDLRRHAA